MFKIAIESDNNEDFEIFIALSKRLGLKFYFVDDKVLKGIETGLKQVKKIKEGKLPRKTLQETLQDKNTPNAKTKKALKDVAEGKVVKSKSHTD